MLTKKITLCVILSMCGLSLWCFAQDWQQQLPPTSPPARDYFGMAYDEVHGSVVLFGGFGAGKILQDTWLWDGSTWTQASPPHSPPARAYHVMAFDATRQGVVLFGGFSDRPLGDTWIWDGTDWTQSIPVTSPPPTWDASMAYDFAHKEVVLFGGARKNLQVSADTWVWDGTNWTKKSPATSPPAQLRQAMAYDATHQQIVLFGGGRPQTSDTWVWDGTTWTQMFPSSKPSARESPALVYNPARGNTVLLGGMHTIIPMGDTWLWDGSNWTQVFPTTSPGERFAAGIAYDLSRAEAILFGGASATGNDTWAWDSLGSYADLYDFDYTHGSSPEGPGLLAQGRDGELYGTTTVGGDFGGGVVLKIAPSGPLSILYNLDAALSGNSSESGLTLGTDGNFYGTAAEGIGGSQNSNCGTIFKITPAGKFSLLYQFQGSADGCHPHASVIQATNGGFRDQLGGLDAGAPGDVAEAGHGHRLALQALALGLQHSSAK